MKATEDIHICLMPSTYEADSINYTFEVVCISVLYYMQHLKHVLELNLQLSGKLIKP